VIGIQRVGTKTAPRAFAETDMVDEAVP
jgi:hypothetical protein